jgi:hemolysin activation/secretion protein
VRGYLSKSANFIDDTEIEVQRRRMAGWEASLNHRRFFANATLDLGAAYRHGTGAFKALHAPEEGFDEGTARPRIVTAEATLSTPIRLARLDLRYTGSWRAQWNLTPLVPLDRFAIGGRYTVRGFDGESVLMADRGWLLRNELGIALGGAHAFYVGLDHGHVGGAQAELLVGRDLTGAVLGLRGSLGGLAYDVFVGQPVSRPDGFRTAGTTAGFNLMCSF